jgi:DNA-binding response OmpR family regulator
VNARLKILVVEDDPASSDVLAEMLTMEGYDVETADSAAEAIAAMTARRHGAALLDLTLQGLTLSDLVERFQQIPWKPPIVVFSGRTVEELEVASARLGAAALLRKPVRMETLLATIARVAQPVVCETAA